MGSDEGNAARAECDLANFEELVGGFLRGDAVDGESALNIVKETEVLARLLDRYNV